MTGISTVLEAGYAPVSAVWFAYRCCFFDQSDLGRSPSRIRIGFGCAEHEMPQLVPDNAARSAVTASVRSGLPFLGRT
jgi:hypothetical protein